MKNKLKQVTYDELKPLRIKLHKQQKGVCPILKKSYAVEDMVIDHKHRHGNTHIGTDDAGLIRGCIHKIDWKVFEGVRKE